LSHQAAAARKKNLSPACGRRKAPPKGKIKKGLTAGEPMRPERLEPLNAGQESQGNSRVYNGLQPRRLILGTPGTA
jgi:hypothetical protein